ncbi:MAG TPA: glycosyltransferase [Saprospiraceae bacterium]|nr:glycosyltransferase [Saprospiraceae bacterium]
MVDLAKGQGSTPLASISCMTFNHAPFIRQCLDHLLSQKTNFPFEIVIHDDASTDGTKEIVEEYVLRYPDIIFPYYQNENQYSKGLRGLPSMYNYPRCRGRYIAICEGDDYWPDPLKLQRQVDFLESHQDYVLTFHDFSVVDEKDQIIDASPLPHRYQRDASSEDLIMGRLLTMTVTLCFRNVITAFPPEKYKVTNGDTFLISMLGYYGKGKWMGDKIEKAMYRSHSGGVWSMISNDDKLPVRVNTFYWLYKYYNRIGKKAYALKWYAKILYTVMMFEPGIKGDKNGHYTDGSNKTTPWWKLLCRKILFKIALWLK